MKNIFFAKGKSRIVECNVDLYCRSVITPPCICVGRYISLCSTWRVYYTFKHWQATTVAENEMGVR